MSVRTGMRINAEIMQNYVFVAPLCVGYSHMPSRASGLLLFSFDVAYLLSLIGSFPPDRGRNNRQQRAKVQHINRP